MDKIVLYCMLKNCVVIICFTILAIIFNKWWIIFFAILFMTSYEHKETTKGENEDDD